MQNLHCKSYHNLKIKNKNLAYIIILLQINFHWAVSTYLSGWMQGIDCDNQLIDWKHLNDSIATSLLNAPKRASDV